MAFSVPQGIPVPAIWINVHLSPYAFPDQGPVIGNAVLYWYPAIITGMDQDGGRRFTGNLQLVGIITYQFRIGIFAQQVSP
jgi:hypothetical protein